MECLLSDIHKLQITFYSTSALIFVLTFSGTLITDLLQAKLVLINCLLCTTFRISTTPPCIYYACVTWIRSGINVVIIIPPLDSGCRIYKWRCGWVHNQQVENHVILMSRKLPCMATSNPYMNACFQCESDACALSNIGLM